MPMLAKYIAIASNILFNYSNDAGVNPASHYYLIDVNSEHKDLSTCVTAVSLNITT